MAEEYCVMRHEKFNSSDNIDALQAETNREWENEEWYRDNVNLELSNLNISLIHSNNIQAAMYHEIMKNGLEWNKDSVLLIGTIYTATPGFFENYKDTEGKYTDEGIDTIKKYFTDCLSFHKSLYGKVLSAEIHLDQKTPHMHVYSVPIIAVQDTRNYYIEAEEIVVKDDDGVQNPEAFDRNGVLKTRLVPKKDSNGNLIRIENPTGKLSDLKKILKETPHLQRKEKLNTVHVGLNGNKALGGKAQLSQHQTLFYEEVGKKYGLSRGECRIGLEPKTHVSSAEWNRKEAERKLQEVTNNVQKAEEELEISTTKKKSIDNKIKDSKDELKRIDIKETFEEELFAHMQRQMEEQLLAMQAAMQAEFEAKQEAMREALEEEFEAKYDALYEDLNLVTNEVEEVVTKNETTSDTYSEEQLLVAWAKGAKNKAGVSMYDKFKQDLHKKRAEEDIAKNERAKRIYGTKKKVAESKAEISSKIDSVDDMSK